jgi:hypothetical protein
LTKIPDRTQPSKPLRCANDFDKFDAFVFHLKTDGRQWKKVCIERRALAARIALRANPDGSNITVGAANCRRVGNWSRAKVFRLLKDLHTIGCLKHERYTDERGIERDRLSKHGTKVRYFDFAPLTDAQEILESDRPFDGHPIVTESHLQEKESHLREGVSDSREGVSRIHETRPYNRNTKPPRESDIALMSRGQLFQLLRHAKAELAKRPRHQKRNRSTE